MFDIVANLAWTSSFVTNLYMWYRYSADYMPDFCGEKISFNNTDQIMLRLNDPNISFRSDICDVTITVPNTDRLTFYFHVRIIKLVYVFELPL